jgi:F420-non-reducing hydrogenase iron-sulfur subunit
MAGGHRFEPRIVGFLCNWCCYAGADLAGVSRYQYPPNIRVIRLMCSGRVDPAFVVRAFAKGADGVFIGGCWLGECHYVTEGNHDALSMVHLTRRLLEYVGISGERLRLEWVSASEGIRFAEVMHDFVGQLERLGPIGPGEGIDPKLLQVKLAAVGKVLPYLKLVEREKLRVRFRTQEEYDRFYAGDEVTRLLDSLIADRLAVGQILALLEAGPLSTREISETLGVSPSAVSRTMNSSSRQGLVRYDLESRRFALPGAGSRGEPAAGLMGEAAHGQ